MKSEIQQYIDLHGLTNFSGDPGDYWLYNEAGFTFDFKHILVDDEFYKAEQEERVEGIDGSYRW